METLIYLIIFAFYIISGYREYQKKRKAKKESFYQQNTKDTPLTPEQPESSESNTQSVLDFLNNAFQEMEKQSYPVEQSNVSSKALFDKTDLISQDSSEHKVEPTFKEHFDLDHDISKVDERHLDNLSTKIKHKKTQYDSYDKKRKIKLIQKKYSKNPFQLAVVMQEILNKPKAI